MAEALACAVAGAGAETPAAAADTAGEMAHAAAGAAAAADLAPADAAAAVTPASAAEAVGAGPASASEAADSAAVAAACDGDLWQWVDVALAAEPPDSRADSHGHAHPWGAGASAGTERTIQWRTNDARHCCNNKQRAAEQTHKCIQI